MILRNKNIILLFAILSLGFLLRFLGSDFGLPHLYHADEPIVVNHALAYGTGDFNPHFFKIPPLISYLLFIIYGLYFCIGRLAGLFPDVTAFEFLFYEDPSSFYWIARIIFGVLTGTLTLLAFYQILKKNFSVFHAAAGTALFAVCFLHVKDSHYIYADIPLLLIIVLFFGVLLSFKQGEVGVRQHLAAGAMIGLASAVKYNGVFLVIPYILVSFSGVKNAKCIYKDWFIAGSCAVITYAILNPFSLLDFSFFMNEMRTQAKSQGGNAGWLHQLKYSLVNGVGLPVLVFAGCGLMRLLFSRDLKRLALASFLVAYYAVLIRFAQPYDRYALPLVPFILFFAVDFAAFIKNHSFISHRPWGKHAGAFLVGALLIPGLIASILFDRIMINPDTRDLAKKWVESEIPAGSRIALDWEFYMPRLQFSKEQLIQKRDSSPKNPYFSSAQKRRLDFLIHQDYSKSVPGYYLHFLSADLGKARFLFAEPLAPYDIQKLSALNIEYVIIARFNEKGLRKAFYESLEKQAEMIAEFNPYRDKTHKSNFDSITMTGGPSQWNELIHRERNGLVLQIYRLQGA